MLTRIYIRKLFFSLKSKQSLFPLNHSILHLLLGYPRTFFRTPVSFPTTLFVSSGIITSDGLLLSFIYIFILLYLTFGKNSDSFILSF